jgi:hypothetical protein
MGRRRITLYYPQVLLTKEFTMKRTHLIAERIREVLLQGKWIANTNFREQLMLLNWEQAVRQIGNLNTIAALTFHVNYYLAGLLHAFASGKLGIRDKYSFDMPPVQSESDWAKLVQTCLSNAEKFADAVDQMDDSLLDKPFIEEKYGTYLRNIEGVIEHCYYHLGQISLIRKLIQEG